MKNLKKVIATLAAAMILTTSTVTVASAGGIVDFFKSTAGVIVNSVKTAGNAVIGAGKYVFTDADGAECFNDTVNSAYKAYHNVQEMGESAVKTVKDVVEFQVGVVQTVGGAVATGVMVATEGVTNLVTGNDDYSWTKATKDFMKDGYDHMDSGFDTMVEAVSLVNPAAGMIANTVKIAKAAGEAAVGYKDRDWEDFGKTAKDSLVNIASGAAGGITGKMAGSAVGLTETAAKVVTTSVGGATKATMKVVTDLQDPNNKRGTLETVAEDLLAAAMTTGAGYGASSACQ